MNCKHFFSFCCFSLRNWWTAWNRNDSFQISPLRWVMEFINKLVIWIIRVNNCLWWTYSKSNNPWSWTICQNRRPLHDHSFVVIIIIIILYIIHHYPPIILPYWIHPGEPCELALCLSDLYRVSWRQVKKSACSFGPQMGIYGYGYGYYTYYILLCYFIIIIYRYIIIEYIIILYIYICFFYFYFI